MCVLKKSEGVGAGLYFCCDDGHLGALANLFQRRYVKLSFGIEIYVFWHDRMGKDSEIS